MEQSLFDWAIEARANANRTGQPYDLAVRWLDLADDIDALIKAITPSAAKD
jgi:hypothetical protein